MSNILDREFMSLLRGEFEGQRFVLVGNGPSLSTDDLNYLDEKKIPSYGVNKIYLSYEATPWRPTLYSSTDHAILSSVVSSLAGCSTKHNFMPLSMKSKIGDGYEISRLTYVNHLSRSSQEFRREFSVDACQATYGGYSVLFFALQMLYSIGVKDVVLLGVDHNYSRAKTRLLDEVSHNGRLVEHLSGSNHFHPDYFIPGEVAGDVYLDEVEESFIMAKECFEKVGGRIVNCSVDSKLGVFERSELRREFS